MASIHKLPGKPNWIAFYKGPDGKQRAKSTKLQATHANRSKALQMAEGLEKAAGGRAHIDQLYELADRLSEEAGGEARRVFTVKEYFTGWLEAKRLSVASSTHTFYRIAAGHFMEWLKKGADLEMQTVTRLRILEYRKHLAARMSPPTVNHNLKFLRMVFRQARREEVLRTDPAEVVETMKEGPRKRRRPFTLEELRKVLAVAEGEWRGLVLFGLYTGQRLGDIARLRWENVDLPADNGRGLLALITGKTHRPQQVPLHVRLREYLEETPASARREWVFPKAAATVESAGGSTASLSNQFADILAAAGLREKVNHGARLESRDEVLAKLYGVATLTLQRWLAAGVALKLPCPIDRPAELLAWWPRCMRRRPGAGVLKAAEQYPGEVPDLPARGPGRGAKGIRREPTGISFHSLRHTATSLLRSAGVSAAVAMDIVGHDDKTMSLHYTHTGDAERRAAVDALPAL